jgi:hypothetical protein
MNKLLYELFYRIPFIPISWIFGSPHEQKEYAQLVENGRIPVGRAIDLGTSVDFSPTAVKRAIANAEAAGMEVTFIEDDLTNFRHIRGTFDLLVDFGAMNDLDQGDRDLYIDNVLPLTHSSSHFILMCFVNRFLNEEIERRFGDQFNIEILTNRSGKVTTRSIDLYYMTRY